MKCGSIEQVFDSFEKTAKSGASLGQIHLARYGGQDVVVKVSRPHIEIDKVCKGYPGAKVYTPIGNSLHKSKYKVLCRSNVFTICRNYW